MKKSSGSKHYLPPAKWVDRALTALLGVSFLLLFFNRELFGSVYWLIIAMPWLAIVLAYKYPALFDFADSSNRRRNKTSLIFALFPPGLIIALYALLLNVVLIDWIRLNMYGALLGTFLLTLAAGTDPALKKKRGYLILLYVFTLVYGYGASFILNTKLDTSAPQIYQTTLLDKRITPGRNKRPQFKLAPWDHETEATDINVDSTLYDQVMPNEKVCIGVHEGALGMAWYKLRPCE